MDIGQVHIMRLFTVGPVMMYPETLELSKQQLPYFRTAEFSEMMLDSERLLKKLVGAGQDHKVAFLTASGTGAMEAAVSCILTNEDCALVVSGGGFGRRFEEICEVHGIPHDPIVLRDGEALSSEHLSKWSGTSHTALLVNLDETSTGQLYDIRMISDFCRENGLLLIVDAISAFLADDIDMIRDGIDALILSSQKALALEPGISAVVLSPRAYEDRVSKIRSPTYYLDLNHHIHDMERGQTPFTPAVGTLITLNGMLHMIDGWGMERNMARIRGLADYFRKGAEDIGLRIPDYPLSNAVTPVLFEGNAVEVYERLREEYDITVTPSGGDLKPYMLRVGHIGNLVQSDYDALLQALKEIIG